MTTLGARLKKARLKKDLTQEQLAEIIGIKQQAIQRIEAGKVKNTCYGVQIAVALDITPEWLVLGHGNFTDRNPINIANEKVYLDTHPTGIPLIEWDNFDAMIEPIIMKNPAKRYPGIQVPEANCFALEIKDNSMQGPQSNTAQFSKGDILIVKTKTRPKSGDLVIAKIGNSSHACFRAYLTNDIGAELKAFNPQYSTIKVTPDIKICGIVMSRYTLLH